MINHKADNTIVVLLKACVKSKDLYEGSRIHAHILKVGLLEASPYVIGRSLISMYSKCGSLSKAQQVLEELPLRDIICWNSLLIGLVQKGQDHDVLNCFEYMQHEGIHPDSVTFTCVLKCCAKVRCLDKGEEIHDRIIDIGLLEKDAMLGTALVDMYAKCGQFARAEKVLKELPVRDLVTWSALIAGYAQQGFAREALSCLEQIESEGLSPDNVTFLCVLSACGHSGLSDEAQIVFENMTKKYGITPNLEHHTSMIVAFGCTGQFDKALSVIKAMPSSDHSVIWLTLLGACKKWGNVKLGKLIFDQALQVDDTCAVAFVLMANIFTMAGMQEDAEKIEAMRLKYAAF